jgi:ATP-dependent DNA helicase RecG
MIAKESNTLEFKLEVADTFLKTVSAFSNYRNGQIKFGVDDNGSVVGLDSIKKDSLKIEHKINDSVWMDWIFTRISF